MKSLKLNFNEKDFFSAKKKEEWKIHSSFFFSL